MVTHNSVPTTCTASHITNWDIPGLTDKDPKLQVNTRIKVVDDLIRSGYKEDFSIIYIITTDQQINKYGLDEFLPLCGFKNVFYGEKKTEDSHQRHKETGSLTMWCVEPRDYKASLTKLKKDLAELKDKIDPPKKPDPARQKFPDLKLSDLRKADIICTNAVVDNGIRNILKVTPKKAELFIKMTFGFDVKSWNKAGDSWMNLTVRQLKDAHKHWKEELV